MIPRAFGLRMVAILLLSLACAPRPAAVVGSRPDSLMARGKALYAAEEYDSALAWFRSAAEAASSSGNDTALALALTEVGLANWRLGREQAASAAQGDALRLKERHRLTASLARSLNALGLLAHDQNRNRDAIRYFERAAASARAAGNVEDEAKALGNQALPATNLGEFIQAREAARGLRAAGRSLDSLRLEGIGLSNEAMVDLALGAPREALARLDTALALYRRIPWRTGEQQALGQVAAAWETMGDYSRVLAVLDTALSIARHHQLRYDEAVNLRLIADVHDRMGDYRRAVRLYQEADSLFRATGLEAERGAGKRGAARAYAALGNVRRAGEAAREALRLHRDAEEPAAALEDLLLLAELDGARAGPSAAQPWLDQARTLAAQDNRMGTRLAVGLATARIADRTAGPRDVLAATALIGPEMRAADLGADWEVSALAARAWGRLGGLDSAVALGHRAVAGIERLRGSLASEALRASLLSSRADVYGDLVLALLRQGRVGEAFTVADAARSRDLLAHLAANRDSTAAGPIPAQLAEAELLLQRIDRLTQRLRDTQVRPPRERGSRLGELGADVASRLATARGEYEALMIRTARDHPRETALLGVGSRDPEQIQALLAPSQVLIEYLMTTHRLVTFVMTSQSIRVLSREADASVLAERVGLLRDLWGHAGTEWHLGLPVSRALYADLIEPLATAGLLEGAEELIVVPQGALARVPFPGLQDQAGRFLVEKFTISQLPSGATLVGLAEPRAEPIVPRGSGTAFAPFPRDLPATSLEVSSITAGLPLVRAVVGTGATEPAVRTALTRGGTVHLATHGILNARNPMFSRVELARGGGTFPAPDNDGRLEVHEILGIRIHSPLVFISGCETGASREWTEDPLMGSGETTLAQAVLAAGANQVVSTLWRIDDAGAATFAGRFYTRVQAAGASQAMALAQRAGIRDERAGNPYYWAGYTVTGLPGRIPKSAGAASVRSTSSHPSRPAGPRNTR